MRAMRDKLHEMLIEKFPDLKLNGHPKNRLPNTLNVSRSASNEHTT
jgi:cysteine desulfurase